MCFGIHLLFAFQSDGGTLQIGVQRAEPFGRTLFRSERTRFCQTTVGIRPLAHGARRVATMTERVNLGECNRPALSEVLGPGEVVKRGLIVCEGIVPIAACARDRAKLFKRIGLNLSISEL